MLNVASKAVSVCQKVINVYMQKDKKVKTNSRLPTIMSNSKKPFENVLRSPNFINEDSDIHPASYIVRTRCNG